MRKLHLFSRGKTQIGKWTRILSMCLLLVGLASCIDGYKDDWEFDSGVYGQQLEAPEKITFTPFPDGTSVTIQWDVVMGAGGYEVTFYDVTNPDKPVVIGKENQFVDGCKVNYTVEEDSRYKVLIKTRGNEIKDNKGSVDASEGAYSTMVETTLIPAGTDLTVYFTEHSYEKDQAFELEAGKNYTMSGNINLGAKNITIQGNKSEASKVIATGGKFISAGAGIKLKYIDFDLSALQNEFIFYDTPDASLPYVPGTTDSYFLFSSAMLKGCKFTGMKNRLLYTVAAKFVVPSFMIDDCIVSTEPAGAILIQFNNGQGYINQLKISNSTFRNTEQGSQRFIQYGNGDVVKSGYANASVTLTNNTWYNISYSQNIASYNMLNKTKDLTTLTVSKNIFVNCGNQEVIKRFAAGNANMKRVCSQNDYWYNGAFPEKEIGSANTGDESTTYFGVDPGFANPAAGDFTISNAELISAGVGDPRWLPNAE